MLKIVVPGRELFNEETSTFSYTEETTICLEHSLLSVSKWESKWHKPFMNKPSSESMSNEELLDYIRCMTITQNIDPTIYSCLSPENIESIKQYIENPMTATTITPDEKSKKSNEIITSEVIYYWMVELGIPFECEKWHLNRLIKLIEVCSIKKAPPKNMTKKEALMRHAKLNAMRRKPKGVH